jgi:recombination protein RecT
VQLAQRTGHYKHLNADSVYEGELKNTDRLTGAVDLSGERISDKIIGYFSYFKTIAGFEKTIFWSAEKMETHAKRYVPAYRQGKHTPWKTNFQEMGIKTVLSYNLKHWGELSIETLTVLSQDHDGGEDGEDIESKMAAESFDFDNDKLLEQKEEIIKPETKTDPKTKANNIEMDF